VDPTTPRPSDPAGDGGEPPRTRPGSGPEPEGTLPTDGASPEGALRHLRTTRGIRGGIALPAGEEGDARETPAEGEGRYTFLGEIARGGMGAVVEIVDNGILRPVAMKVILGDEDPSRLERFVEEAQITGQLEHPNIVPVHELGVNGEGRAYFTMILVRGETLEEVLDAIAEGDRERIGRFPLPSLLEVFLKVCDAVAFAHSRGVIHRDLKPENVMVGRFGEVLVMDWGLS
jgi:serine/threonine protein kinase